MRTKFSDSRAAIPPYYAELWREGERKAGLVRSVALPADAVERLDALVAASAGDRAAVLNEALARGRDVLRASGDDVRQAKARLGAGGATRRVRFRPTSITEAILFDAEHRGTAAVLVRLGLAAWTLG